MTIYMQIAQDFPSVDTRCVRVFKDQGIGQDGLLKFCIFSPVGYHATFGALDEPWDGMNRLAYPHRIGSGSRPVSPPV